VTPLVTFPAIRPPASPQNLRKGCDLKLKRLPSPFSFPPGRLAAAALAAAAAFAASPASATLGQSLSSVEVDRMQLKASVTRTNHVAYTVHEMALGGRGVVREYAAPNGTVFAVTWHTPSMPNLQQLLGIHYDELVKATSKHRGGLSHMDVHTDRVAFVSNGRLRSFHGGAYLIQGVPSGVSVDDIK
jgi:hypothetical protein